MLQKYIKDQADRRDASLDFCRRPVVNLTNGETFRCARAADKHYGYPTGSVNTACNTGYQYMGNYWQWKEFVDKNGIEYERQIHKIKVIRSVVCLNTGDEFESRNVIVQ